VSKVIGPEDGVCVTPRGVVHSIKSFRGEEMIIEETTLPSVETVSLPPLPAEPG
jgi:mannose-6-phosphate isomerase-like protein (cupin superfamily)